MYMYMNMCNVAIVHVHVANVHRETGVQPNIKLSTVHVAIIAWIKGVRVHVAKLGDFRL